MELTDKRKAMTMKDKYFMGVSDSTIKNFIQIENLIIIIMLGGRNLYRQLRAQVERVVTMGSHKGVVVAVVVFIQVVR